jgi:hypothetical protein
VHTTSDDSSPVASIKCGRSRNAACAIISAAKSYAVKSRSSPAARGYRARGRHLYLQKKGGDEAASYFKEVKDAWNRTARGRPRPEMSSRVFGALSSAKALDKLLHRGRAPGVFLSQCGNYLFRLFVFAFHSRHMLDLFLKRRLHFLGRR